MAIIKILGILPLYKTEKITFFVSLVSNTWALFQADAASDKELCEALRIKLDRMKGECDKLATQLSTKDEAHALLLKKYHLLKQELHSEVSHAPLCLVLKTWWLKLSGNFQ